MAVSNTISKKKKDSDGGNTKCMVVIPYVEALIEKRLPKKNLPQTQASMLA